MKKGIIAFIVLVAVAVVVAVVVLRPAPVVAPPGPDSAAVADNNLAVGYMGRYEYEDARKLFEQVSQRYPDLSDVKVNLAIATLNRQQAGDEETALALLQQVLVEDPEHLRARYCTALLQLYLGEPETALEHFRAVAEADPEDAYAVYYVAQCLGQARELEAAAAGYARAIELDPYLRSAYYGAQQALQRLGRRDEAQEMLGAFTRLDGNPRARLVEFVYTKMGPNAQTVAFDVAQADPVQRPEGALFVEARGVLDGADGSTWNDRAAAPVSVTAVDIDGDGDADLFAADAMRHGDGVSNAVLVNDGGAFRLDLDHVLATVSSVRAALWGDVDNDGLTDVYLCRNGPNQLWRQTASGAWTDVTAESDTDNGDLDTVDGMIFDADHDGDLDLFCVNADGPNELLNNNLDGTFRKLAEEYGLSGGDRPSRQIAVTDLDRDRDADLIVIHETPPHEVFLNDRLWSYRPALGFEAFTESEVGAVVTGDLDADGRVELYTVDPAGVRRWRRDGADTWTVQQLADGDGAVPRPGIALADVDGDGRHELLASRADGWRFWFIDGNEVTPGEAIGSSSLAGWTVANLEPGRGPSVVGMPAGAGPQVWSPGPGRFEFVSLALTGKEDAGQSMRSNASGIGVLVEARIGSTWTVLRNFRRDSGPGQSLLPLAIGLGGAPSIDFIALEWSDGVFQSELALDPGETRVIEETQRQLSSCPVLFAWNGKKYEFVSDLLGVGGIGFAVGPGAYAPSRPREDFLLPEGLAVPRDGRYELKLGEPMEEACYLDKATLAAVDLPPGWSVVLDERMGILGPEPTGETRFYRHELMPRRVTNDRGADVTSEVLEADLRAAPVGPLDERFIGRLKRPHAITLEFEVPLDAYDGAPMLVADGWIEYPYSQTMFAAWQAGAEYMAPTIEAETADGAWQVVLEQFGYPAGMPRRMSVALTDLPLTTRRLRITTNQEIYWDRLSVAYAEPCPNAKTHDLDLAAARMRRSGFARRTTAPQRLPYYDYDDRLAQWDTRYQEGLYTRFGPVEPLVAEFDDALAVFGPGEEIHLEFVAPADALPPGWTRHLVLHTDGWCKDMDLFTEDGDSVGPLPTTGKPAAERDRLHGVYNSRFQTGR